MPDAVAVPVTGLEPAIHAVEIVVNYRRVHVPQESTGAAIVSAAGLPQDFRLFRIEGALEVPIEPGERIRVRAHEHFVACPTLDPAFVSNPAHAAAIESVRSAFAAHEIDVDEPGDGSTIVTVRGVDVGSGWNIRSIDLAVKLQVTFPSSPPYPFYGPSGMARIDGAAFPQLQPHVQLDGVARTQISLNKPFDPAAETLASRLVGAIAWLRNPR